MSANVTSDLLHALVNQMRGQDADVRGVGVDADDPGVP